MIKTFKFTAVPGTQLSPHISKHYPIDWTGKHYLMQEKKGDRYVGNIRHYTVSNCMAADAYAEYCKALESHIGVAKGQTEKIYRMDQSLITVRPSTDFSLTLKVYWEAKGFSARMFESSAAKDNSVWLAKGPMGKSLGVKRSGQHLAFAAGTGAITFMDLSAYVARFVMGEMDEKESSQIDDDFKFTYYVTYYNEEQSCGLRMLRLLKELNSKHFDLVVRLSSQRSARWDEKYLAGILPPTCEKLWVCGTPVMNDVFEVAFHHLAPQFPYLKDLEVVQVL